jgi:hypothetical protein
MSPRKLMFGVAVVAIAGLGSAARATTVDTAYFVDWCRFGSWSTCGATGECATPSQIAANGWTLDNSKIQPKSDQTAIGYPLELICPIVRVFKNGASNTKAPPLNVQISLGTVPNKTTDCTVYSLTKYGAVKQKQSFSLSSGGGSSSELVKTLKITDTDADGSFSMACKLPNTYPDTTAGLLHAYRTEETSTSTDAKWRTYPASRCSAQGSNVQTKLRLSYNKATNVDTVTRDVTCPVVDVVGVGSGMSTKYTATVYVNETNAKGGSQCRLVARDHYSSNIVSQTPYIKTSASGDTFLALAYLPSQELDYSYRYTVDCQLTAGSSIYQYVAGY